jgi:hypothetical protein
MKPIFVHRSFLFLGLGASLAGYAINPQSESDLTHSGDFDVWSMATDTHLVPSGQETLPADHFQIQITRKIRETETSIPGLTLALSNGQSIQLGKDGSFKAPAFCSGKVSATVTFETPYFAVGVKSWGSGENYSLTFDLPCSGQTRVWAEKGTPLASVLSIWTIGYKAQEKMKEAVGLDFWKNKVDFNYPADGAYYSANTVNIPNGEEWDVVGHELGHAMFDQGNVGRMQGGQHYIDRCYNDTLALSEGWASFFSAFLSVELDDKDAKFEYMVPRRAPLRIETIPADVCNGYANEWRVTGFLWDVIDTNPDNEMISELFGAAWNLTAGKMAASLTNIRDSLVSGGFNREEIAHIFAQNAEGGSPPPPAPPFKLWNTSDPFQSFDDFLRQGRH